MQLTSTYKLSIDSTFSENELLNGNYIVVMHATRIPPHIGLIVDKHYHSLTIKGQDINTPIAALVKNIQLRKLPSLFIKIKDEKSVANVSQRESFISNIKQFPRVDIGVATCLSPIKLFFKEVYNVDVNEINFLFELLPLLYSKGLIENTSSLFVDEANYELPIYSSNEINAGITQVREEFRKN